MHWLFALLFSFSSLFANEPLEFVVVTPSYNNEAYCLANLESLANQSYPYWKLIYINDCSQDKTGAVVEEYVRTHNLSNRVKIIHNTKRVGAMANLYKWIHKIDPDKVVIQLDGDDRLAHKAVLERLSFVYADKEIWMTYGSYRSEPDSFWHINAPIPEKVMKNNRFRKHDFVTSHLKSYYAKLFHNIKKRDLMYKGEFLPTGSDVAIMLPILEQAQSGHIRFIKEVLYVYNYTNPINDHKICNDLRDQITAELRARKPYKPLKSLF